jgi:predicted O-linked N-acetylglucosamine transferase (SPINDLY family)
MTARFQQTADAWRDIAGMSDAQAARQIEEDQIDILVDLTVHLADNRLLVFARKPAALQVTYLGYCGSTGLDTVDYRLSDPHLDPPESDLSGYSEKTVRLPRTYWCYQPIDAPDVAPLPALKSGRVTFGCMNVFAKVSQPALDLWARILRGTPGSRLMIHSPPGAHLERLAARMLSAGVTADRVAFVATQPWDKYLETYGEIDICLDPFPYAGGITTCDALWMGAPVVSLSGQTAVGRGGRGILTNIGLAELVAYSPDEYARLAIELAQDLPRLQALRADMRRRMLQSPLMDAPALARDIEAAYRQMWRDRCEGRV